MTGLAQLKGTLPVTLKVSSPTPPGVVGIVDLLPGKELLSLLFYGVLLDRPLRES